ncbi:Uncharacterised protein [Segatella copri]|nr:Uncharacterised protein [Segatella copri]
MISTTVRQTPLCATLWSMPSSSTKEHLNVKSMFSLSCLIATTVAISSTIPLNIYSIFIWFHYYLECKDIALARNSQII